MSKIIVNPEYKDLLPFLRRLELDFETTGDLIYDGRNQLKTYQIAGYHLVVKRFKVPHLLNRIVYSFFRKSKARRSYENALRLLKEGFLTPEPLGYIEEYKCGLLWKSYYIARKSESRYHFFDLAKREFDNKDEILKAYALFLAALHKKHILHKDLSMGNVLFDFSEDTVVFELVDINRMQFGELSFNASCSNFKRTIGDDDSLKYIASCYAVARNFDEGKSVEKIVSSRNRFFKKKSIDKLTGKKIK